MAEPNSTSITMIQGPPGTGKTTSIVQLIGAIMHHNAYGHLDSAEPYNLLKRKDGVLRSSTRSGALKILITAGSNQAVENVLRGLRKVYRMEEVVGSKCKQSE